MSLRLQRYCGSSPYSYAFGAYPTIELLSARPRQVRGVLLLRPQKGGEGVQRVHELCRALRVRVGICPNAIRRISHRDFPVVGVFEKYDSPVKRWSNHVVLYRPQYEGNLGTVVRTMVGFGLTDLVLIGQAPEVLNPGVVRASMGAAFHLRWSRFADLAGYRRQFGQHRLYCFRTDGRQSIRQCVPRRPFSLIFGSEGEGLPASAPGRYTTVRIPHAPRIDSLNLGVAVGIALYCVVRRQEAHE